MYMQKKKKGNLDHRGRESWNQREDAMANQSHTNSFGIGLLFVSL